MTTAAPAQNITKSAHTGSWVQTPKPGTYQAASYMAGELAGMLDGEFVVWESAGHLRNGRELFHRARYVGQSDGSLAGYDSNGRRTIIHPADRRLVILTK